MMAVGQLQMFFERKMNKRSSNSSSSSSSSSRGERVNNHDILTVDSNKKELIDHIYFRIPAMKTDGNIGINIYSIYIIYCKTRTLL